MSVTATPVFDGAPRGPVTDMRPESAWTSGSYPGSSASSPKPLISQWITPGFVRATVSWSSPRRARAPGRRFATTTSAPSHSRRASSSSRGSSRSSTTERLLRFAVWWYDARPCASTGGFQRRVSSPCGDSILTTSAPRSPSVMATSGPASTRDRSTTRIPSSGSATGPVYHANPCFAAVVRIGRCARCGPSPTVGRMRAASFVLLALAGAFLGIVLAGCGDGSAKSALATVSLPATTAQRTTDEAPVAAPPATTTAPGRVTTVTQTETQTETQTQTQTETRTETRVETRLETTTEAAPAPAPAPTTTPTTTEGVTPAAAAAAGAAVAATNAEATTEDTPWGWIAFVLLLGGVVTFAIVWWLRRRSAQSGAAGSSSPA